MEILYPLIAAISIPTRTRPGEFFENRGCELVLQVTEHTIVHFTSTISNSMKISLGAPAVQLMHFRSLGHGGPTTAK